MDYEYHEVNQYIQHVSIIRRREEKRAETLFEEIMSKNFSNLAQNMKKQNQETVSLSRINSHISTLRHIIIKLFKEKES